MSQIVRSAITSVFLAMPGSNLVGRYSLTPYTSLQKIISITFIVNKISLLVSSTYGTITFWPVRCFSIIVSLLCHQHIRNTPVGCNRMPRTQNTWPRFDIHIIDEVIKNPNPKISLSVSSMYWSKSVVRYMDDTDSDILGLGFLITSSIMWISNRGHVFCVRGIRLHPTGVFSNVLMTKKRHDNRKTSDWSKSDCSVRGRYQQRYLV